jgi:GT2 family glycosyltransferase
MGDNRAHPDVSVLLVSWNTRSLTEECLASLPGSVAAGVRYEVIAVDNGSTDGSVELLRGLPEVLLIENGENRGFSAAVNQAYARSTGRLVLLLNSDIEFKPGALSALLGFLDEHPRAAGVGPRYLNPDGSPQQHHFRLPTMSMLMASSSRVFRALPGFSGSLRRYRMDDDDFTCARQVEQPSASVLLLRRSALPHGWLLDEGFPIFFNDVELAWRLRRQGFALWYTPDAEVYHAHGASTRQLGAGLRRQHLASLIGYLKLTEPRRKRIVFTGAMFLHKGAQTLARRPSSLPFHELIPALRGDPGPLPHNPSREPQAATGGTASRTDGGAAAPGRQSAG